ncbi:CCAAT-binding factor domain-containing protein [Rozella allomycis CSF55]|uniref:CCAAT-binding factor domain-containing protein n=1 Tax=Rozella allomycis (strain CSF55) TaxID=988480 RepID=A0A075B1H7_ROZAC|nr:CCAAT-binding factor domain-containing protein [Rozella allomycis CSF55]|eukprot:EPZ36208.1 CCAAT-binding factor domain-containing protein [Rozella allomycis CSF55]
MAKKEHSKNTKSHRKENNSDSKPKILMPIDKPWFTTEIPTDATRLNLSVLEEAKKLYEEDVELYKKLFPLSRSDEDWYQSILRNGALKDKVGALSVKIRSSPFHSLSLLEQLLAMAEKKNRKEATMAVDVLKELLLNVVLPDRKLLNFHQYPFTKEPKILAMAYFEHSLKALMFKFVKLLEAYSVDPLYFVKYKAVNVLYEMLVAKPEQEQNMLTLLTNKLGDPEHKVSSRASYLLTQVLQSHPMMKMIVIKEIEAFFVRQFSNIECHYYGYLTLSQIVIGKGEQEVANYLINLYLTSFNKIVKKDDNDRSISAILTGVHRIYPFSDKSATLTEHLNVLFKMIHTGAFNTSIQALNVLYQIACHSPELMDRFLRALYEFILDHRFYNHSNFSLFFNVLYKAVSSDSNTHRIQSFLKRLLSVSAMHDVPFICTSLIFVSEIFKLKPGLRTMLTTPEELEDDEKYPYDASKRDPAFTGANSVCLWEISILKEHFHPTVAQYAKRLLSGGLIECSVDPLQHYTPMMFLDRFIYKNPKQVKQSKSLLQAKEVSLPFIKLNEQDNSSMIKKLFDRPVNQGVIEQLQASQVPVEELFFYHYFKMKPQVKKNKKTFENEEDFENDMEEEIDRILMGGIGENDDEDTDGLDDEDDEDLDDEDVEELDDDDMEDMDDLDEDEDDEQMDGFDMPSDEEMPSDMDDELPSDDQNNDDQFASFSDEESQAADFEEMEKEMIEEAEKEKDPKALNKEKKKRKRELLKNVFMDADHIKQGKEKEKERIAQERVHGC